MKPNKHQPSGTLKMETTLYDTASNLKTDVCISAPQEKVLSEGQPQVIANVLDATERAKAKASLRENQLLAKINGLSQITDEEINHEIRMIRAARREKKKDF